MSISPGVLGPDVFGKVELQSHGTWTWVIKDADWQVRSDVFATQELATQDLETIQGDLIPEWLYTYPVQ